MKKFMAVFVGTEASMKRAAESHEVAAKLFLNHPHFAIFSGDNIKVMECLPIPGM
jgi:hypothetical protein